MDSDSYVTLTDLPCEVIELILSGKEISHREICSVSSVCHKLRDVATSGRLWHIKFCQVWGSLCDLFDNQNADWKEAYEQRYKYGLHVQKLLSTMCKQANSSHVVEESFYNFRNTSREYRFATEFMLDELELVLFDGQSYSKLTTKYYCSKLYHFAHQFHLQRVFHEFLSSDIGHQPLEIGACLISQFCQPLQRTSIKDISEKLDCIAMNVKDVLKQDWPKHPVLLKDLIPASTALHESLWSPSECRTILMSLNTTLFNNLEFVCIWEHDGFSSDQILINKVLNGKVGVPVVTAIIYAAVAHRLGVLCELCEGSFSALKWLEYPSLDKINRYTFIDVTKNGQFSTSAEFTASTDLHSPDAEECPARLPSEVYKYILKNLAQFGGRDVHHLDERLQYESGVLKLALILSPNNKEKILTLVQLYLQMDMLLLEAEDLMQHFRPSDLHFHYRAARLRAELECRIRSRGHVDEDDLKAPKTKLRENYPSVSFAVGMIMKHKKYDYVCVIYGWDSVCLASDHWIQQMRVYELNNKHNQPFYNVLVEDCTQRYAAQENLEICGSPTFIEHPKIGKYFDEFQRTHFEPNEVLSAEYPQDASARAALLKDFYAGNSAAPPLDV